MIDQGRSSRMSTRALAPPHFAAGIARRRLEVVESMLRCKLTVIACLCCHLLLGVSSAPAADYVQDFREPLNDELFKLNGARARQYSQRTADGLLLAIPGDREGTTSVQAGVVLKPKVVGDFEAT